MKVRKSVWLDEEDGDLIREVREAGVRELARSCEMSSSHISRWLRGQTGMADEKFAKLCEGIMAKAITPTEAMSLHEPDRREVDRIIEQVSDGLRSYTGERPHTVSAKLLGKGKVLTAVLREFEAAGWRVKYQSDQRDGDYYEFKH